MPGFGEAVQETFFRWGTRPAPWPLRPFVRLAFAGWMTVFYYRHPMSRGRRLRAVASVWLWQLWRRVVRRPVLVELQTGARLVCPPWSKMAGAWIAVGLHEPSEMLFAHDLLRPGDAFVDVGANLGVYSMIAAGRGARAIAFEPNADARGALEENARRNGARVEVLPFAAADMDARARLTTDLESSNHLVLSEAPGAVGVEIEVRRVDTVVPPLLGTGESIALMKVDAEGFDADVLRGARSVLAVHKPAVVVEIWAGGREVREVLAASGYDVFFYDADAHALVPIPEDYARHGYFLGVHRERRAATEARLREPRTLVRAAPRVTWLAR